MDIYIISCKYGPHEVHVLVIKMNDDFHAIEAIKTTIEFLCNIEVVMGLTTCIMPKLVVVHEFIKFIQSHDTFVCDFARVVKKCCAYMYTLYCNLKKKYNDEQFMGFIYLVDCGNDGLSY